jgi:hypothetical protein
MPGELVHIDVKKLGDERAETVSEFLQRALAWFAEHGVLVQRLMTDRCCFFVKWT